MELSVMKNANAIPVDVRAEIEALISEHAWFVDHGHADRLHELYTADGRLLGIGPDMNGRQAIADYGSQRGKMAQRTARHICANARLVTESADRIRGTVPHTLYRHDGEGRGLPEPMAVGDYEDIYVRDVDGRWRFAERRVVVVFESAAHRG
jgi:hypothetical protein